MKRRQRTQTSADKRKGDEDDSHELSNNVPSFIVTTSPLANGRAQIDICVNDIHYKARDYRHLIAVTQLGKGCGARRRPA